MASQMRTTSLGERTVPAGFKGVFRAISRADLSRGLSDEAVGRNPCSGSVSRAIPLAPTRWQ